MAQVKELCRILTSAGSANHLQDEGLTFLYTNDSSLTSKQWSQTGWGDEDVLVEDVRAGSPAAYLLTPSTNIIFYISSSSLLSAIRFDDEEEEWVPVANLPKLQVHPEGKLAAIMLPGPDGRFAVYYQDPSKHLIQLDNEWKSTTVPVDAVSGGPLSVTYIDGDVALAYVASDGQSVVYVAKSEEGWTKAVPVTKCDEADPLARFIVGWDDEKDVVELYGVSAGGTLALYKEEGEKTVMGKVDKEGNYNAATSAEAGHRVRQTIINRNVYQIINRGSGTVNITPPRSRIHSGGRRRRYYY